MEVLGVVVEGEIAVGLQLGRQIHLDQRGDGALVLVTDGRWPAIDDSTQPRSRIGAAKERFARHRLAEPLGVTVG